MRITEQELRRIIRSSLAVREVRMLNPKTGEIKDIDTSQLRNIPKPSDNMLKGVQVVFNILSPMTTEDAESIYYSLKQERYISTAKTISKVLAAAALNAIPVLRLGIVIKKIFNKVGVVSQAGIRKVKDQVVADVVKNHDYEKQTPKKGKNKGRQFLVKKKSKPTEKSLKSYKRKSDGTEDLIKLDFKGSVSQALSPRIKKPILVDLISGKQLFVDPAYARGKTPNQLLKQYASRFKNRHKASLKDNIHFAILDGDKPIAKFKKQKA